MHLGQIIKIYRKEHDLTMEEFGKLIGRTKAYISMLEKNKNSRSGKEIVPSVETLVAVANVLGISMDTLLKQLDPDSPVMLYPNQKVSNAQNEKQFSPHNDTVQISTREKTLIKKYRVLPERTQDEVDEFVDFKYQRHKTKDE